MYEFCFTTNIEKTLGFNADRSCEERRRKPTGTF